MFEELKGKELSSQEITDLYKQNIDYYNKIAGEELEFDLLRLYFGEDYQINDKIFIRQPTIQDIIDMGEKEFYATIAPFTSNPTSLKVQLWDLGIDWNDITDFELFSLLIKTVSVENTRILFGNLDFSSFELVGKLNENGEVVPILYSESQQMEIDEDTYFRIRKYVCFMFNSKLENENIKSKSLRAEVIAKARADEARERAENKNSSLVRMISFALNHPGFKYKKNELRDIGYVEFIDSIKQLQIYEGTRALMQGSYSGFCDVSKIPKEEFNFMRNITI